ARHLGRKDSDQAYQADALLAMAEESRTESGKTGNGGPGAMVHVMVDHSALIRGEVHPGETCEIPGIGPIPVATARSMVNDAFLAVLVTDGTDIQAVAHMGRLIPARLRTALDARDPVCVVPGCGERKRLDIDHIVPVEEGGPTCLSNCAKLCRWHHYLKTHQGHQLSGKPGTWNWAAPIRR
ncbi:MAG: DUF222 domain-containing protein, partial [Actinomycetota bacterium]